MVGGGEEKRGQAARFTGKLVLAAEGGMRKAKAGAESIIRIRNGKTKRDGTCWHALNGNPFDDDDDDGGGGGCDNDGRLVTFNVE